MAFFFFFFFFCFFFFLSSWLLVMSASYSSSSSSWSSSFSGIALGGGWASAGGVMVWRRELLCEAGWVSSCVRQGGWRRAGCDIWSGEIRQPRPRFAGTIRGVSACVVWGLCWGMSGGVSATVGEGGREEAYGLMMMKCLLLVLLPPRLPPATTHTPHTLHHHLHLFTHTSQARLQR